MLLRSLGLDDYVAQILPEDKCEYVKKFQQEGYTVAMVGDGINDSPALAVSDVHWRFLMQLILLVLLRIFQLRMTRLNLW